MERGVMTWVVVGSEWRKTERWLIGGGGVEWGKAPWRNGTFGFTLRSRYRLSGRRAARTFVSADAREYETQGAIGG